ncbi:ribosome modulation factor [Methylobacterium oryzae CBMB20]
MDIIKLGARARAVGRPRDACPYPGDSRERRAWFEGYDGSSWEMASRCLIRLACCRT